MRAIRIHEIWWIIKLVPWFISFIFVKNKFPHLKDFDIGQFKVSFSRENIKRFFSSKKDKRNQHYKNSMQRPFCYFSLLTAKPWHDVNNEYTQLLESNVDIIRDEYLEVQKHLSNHPEAEDLGACGHWKNVILIRKGVIKKNTKLCSETYKILIQLPLCYPVGLAYFSVLEPNTHIQAHCGPTNLRLRYHLGLFIPDNCFIRVGEETRSWKQDKCIVFDDSFEHEVYNNSNERRVVLIVDMLHHDLSQQEIDWFRCSNHLGKVVGL